LLVYIACPYRSPDPLTVENRITELEKNLAWLYVNKPNWTFINPLSAHYSVKHDKKIPTDFMHWQYHAFNTIDACDAVLVLDNLAGWDRSEGVKAEIQYAKDVDAQVIYMSEIKNG
jgi:hypothetical protein